MLVLLEDCTHEFFRSCFPNQGQVVEKRGNLFFFLENGRILCFGESLTNITFTSPLGEVKRWYPNGKKEYFSAPSVNGKREGRSMWWFSSGKLQAYEDWVNDLMHGESKQWDIDGTIVFHEIRDRGAMINKIV